MPKLNYQGCYFQTLRWHDKNRLYFVIRVLVCTVAVYWHDDIAIFSKENILWHIEGFNFINTFPWVYENGGDFYLVGSVVFHKHANLLAGVSLKEITFYKRDELQVVKVDRALGYSLRYVGNDNLTIVWGRRLVRKNRVVHSP